MRRPLTTSFLSLDIQLSTGIFLLHRDNLRAGATSGHFVSQEYLFPIFIFSITISIDNVNLGNKKAPVKGC
nr:MAG TPA: hypothetical protein [Caudoviricetes sp.]